MIAILISITIAVIAATLLTAGISKMHEEHPDYKGDDFLNP